jgi:Tol biopolymer transport system component
LVITPTFSPGGDLLAWTCIDSWSSYSIHVMRLNDGTTTKLVDRVDGVGGLAWSRDGERIVFSSPQDFGDLREVQMAHPNFVEKIPVGHDASDIALSLAGGRLAYVQGITTVNIWRVDLVEPEPVARPLIVSSREQKSPNISPDQTRIAFESNRSGINELWICDADGSNAIPLTSFGIRATGTPRWSPDGSTIAFDSRATGEANIYLIDPKRGTPRRLEITNIRGNNVPSWSHDGQWIYFVNGEDAHQPSVWKVPAQGGSAVEVARAPATYPIESPDGRFLYFIRAYRLWRSNTDGTAQEEVEGMHSMKNLGDKWVPFGGGIYFLAEVNNKVELDLFDLQTGRTRNIKTLDGAPPQWMGQMSISSDGKWIIYPQVDASTTNLMMIEGWH